MDLSRFSAAPTARLQIHTISPVPRAELPDVKATLKFNNFLIILDLINDEFIVKKFRGEMHMPLQSDFQSTKLLRRYFVAVTVLVLLIFGGYLFHFETSRKSALDQEIINVSGQQRMLSQRIALLAHWLSHDELKNNWISSIMVENIKDFEHNHRWITSNGMSLGPEIESHYFGTSRPNLDQRTQEFARVSKNLLSGKQNLTQSAKILKYIEVEASGPFLKDLDRAVKLFEVAANGRAERLDIIQRLAVAATLIVLFIEILFVFYPGYKKMQFLIQRLNIKASTDDLTELENRSGSLARLRALFEDSPKKIARTVLFAVDLDDFKGLNDTFGHPAGDQILQNVAHVMKQTLANDERLDFYCASRTGGDEFILWACVSSLFDQKTVVRTLCQQLDQRLNKPIKIRLLDHQIHECNVSVSIGYVLGQSPHTSVETFLSRADMALYFSKSRGKGVATEFTSVMEHSGLTQKTLNPAFERPEFS